MAAAPAEGVSDEAYLPVAPLGVLRRSPTNGRAELDGTVEIRHTLLWETAMLDNALLLLRGVKVDAPLQWRLAIVNGSCFVT